MKWPTGRSLVITEFEVKYMVNQLIGNGILENYLRLNGDIANQIIVFWNLIKPWFIIIIMSQEGLVGIKVAKNFLKILFSQVQMRSTHFRAISLDQLIFSLDNWCQSCSSN